MLRCRRATADDAAVIARIFRATFASTYPNFPTLHSPEEDLAHFTALLGSHTVVAGENGDKLVGYCAFASGWTCTADSIRR